MIESWNHLACVRQGSHEVVFDVRLPADHAVDVRAPDAWAVSAATHADADAQADQQAWMVALLGSLYDAVARASRDWLVGFATTRAPSGLGAPLATLPRVGSGRRNRAGCMRTVLLDDHAARTDAGHAPTVTTSGSVKRTVTEHAIRVVEQALKLSGNHGLSRANPLERHYRDVLCSRACIRRRTMRSRWAGRASGAQRRAGMRRAAKGETETSGAPVNETERGRNDA